MGNIFRNYMLSVKRGQTIFLSTSGLFIKILSPGCRLWNCTFKSTNYNYNVFHKLCTPLVRRVVHECKNARGLYGVQLVRIKTHI